MHVVEPRERRTFAAIALVWGPSVFVANWLLYQAGAMSFLPWVNNFLHTFVWIGFCLTWLYLGVRERESLFVQCVIFATFSLVVKYAEQKLFGTWDKGDFFGIDGNGCLRRRLVDRRRNLPAAHPLRSADRFALDPWARRDLAADAWASTCASPSARAARTAASFARLQRGVARFGISS